MKKKLQFGRFMRRTGIAILMAAVLVCLLGITTEKYFVVDTHGKLHGFLTYSVPETGEQGSLSNGKITFSGVNTVIVGGILEYGGPGIPNQPLSPKRKIKFDWKQLILKNEERMTMAAILPTMRSRKIILTNPPVSSPWHYPAGISYLASFLRQNGHDVRLLYAHIAGLEHTLRQQDITTTNAALGIVRNKNSTIDEWYAARQMFESISAAVPTLDKFSVARNNVLYVGAHQDGTIDGALLSVKKREQCVWYPYFNTVEVPFALSEKPDMYGISIAEERQLIPGLILGSMIKEACPETLVVLGGNFWSRVATAYTEPKFAELFTKCCDAIVYREGFWPMLELAEGLDPSRVSGTVWMDNFVLRVNAPTVTPIAFESLPTPAFDGGSFQFSPDQVYPLYTTSNCFMQCEFCSISSGSDTFLGKPRTTSSQRIVEQMVATGGHRFDFYDEMLPVATQLKIGEELKRRGYYAEWYCYTTADSHFLHPDTCQKLYEAGCRGVQIGLESLDTTTLGNENKKWNKPENYARILSNLKNAGIQTHVFILVGLPGEPLEQTLKWLGFLDTYGDSILTIKAGRYRVAKNAPDERNGQFQNIELLPDTRHLHLNRDFRYKLTSNKKVDALRDLLEQACREHWAYGVTSSLPWWTNRGRYTWDELREMSFRIPKDEPVEHLNKIIVKANTIIREGTGQNVHFQNFKDLTEFTKTI